MKLTFAGQSHGSGIFGIIENIPFGMTIDQDKINRELKLRQGGYGRGDRQKIEFDKVCITSGVVDKKVVSGAISLLIANKDSHYIDKTSQNQLTCPRANHADLCGMIRYNTNDITPIMENASARNTCIKVACGSIAKQFLELLGIEVAGFVRGIYNVYDNNFYSFERLKQSKQNQLYMLDKSSEAVAVIDSLKAEGDTAGGVVEVRVNGIKPGIGGVLRDNQKLSSKLASYIFAVQAVKGLEIGDGFSLAKQKGSQTLDNIVYDGEFKRQSNHMGGLEGGISTGEEIILKVAMKPIPTLKMDTPTIDYVSKQKINSASVRSDVVAVPAFLVVIESVVATCIAEAIIEQLGQGGIEQLVQNYNNLQ